MPLRDLLQTAAVGAVADDHAAQVRVGCEGLEQEVVPLCAVEPADAEHEVVVALGPVRKLLRRVRHHLGFEPGRTAHALGHVARGCKELAGLAERDPVEAMHGAPRGALLGALTELAELGAVELVRLPELVQEPNDLVRMPDRVGRELRRDHEVDRATVGLGQVEQTPEEGLREHALPGVPLVRHGDQVGLVSARPQLLDEVVGEDLGPTARERHLRRADGNSHALSIFPRVCDIERLASTPAHRHVKRKTVTCP